MLPVDVIYHMIYNEYLSMLQHYRGRTERIKRPPDVYELDIALRQHKEQRAHLVVLCLVSWTFFNVAQPLLHRLFLNDARDAGDQRLNLFLRTLSARPDLALRVQDIRLQLLYECGALYPSDDSASTMSDQSDVADLACPGNPPVSEHPIEETWEEYSAKHAQLINLCKNVQTLQVLSDSDDCSWFFNSLRDEDTETVKDNRLDARLTQQDSASRLTCLRRLIYHHLDGDEYCAFRSLTSCLRCPRIKSLYLSRLNLSASKVKNYFHTSLTEVYFLNSIWSTPGVRDLLICCPRLKVLQLRASICENDWDRCGLNFSRLGAILRKHGTSLESLTIDARGSLGYGLSQYSYKPLLGSLKDLIHLRRLRVPLPQLLGHADMDSYFDGKTTKKSYFHPAVLSRRLERKFLPDSIEHVYLLNPSAPGSGLIHLDYIEQCE